MLSTKGYKPKLPRYSVYRCTRTRGPLTVLAVSDSFAKKWDTPNEGSGRGEKQIESDVSGGPDTYDSRARKCPASP